MERKWEGLVVKQMTLARAKGFELHGRATRKAEFLARMEALVPWAQFCAVIEPHYPKAGNGRPPVRVERMLRMYFVANWFNLRDEACEDALYDIPAFRDFCRIDLGRERVPDATTLLNFRHLLEKHHRRGAVRQGGRAAAGQRHEALRGHHRGCHADRSTAFDQEPGAKPRPADASKQEG
jgi:IS5 family transposase